MATPPGYIEALSASQLTNPNPAANVQQPQPIHQGGKAAGNVLGLVQDLMNMHAQKQNQGFAKLQQFSTLKAQGFPVDPKQVNKAIKQAKLPVDTTPEGLANALQTLQMQQKKSGQTSQGPGQQQGQQKPPDFKSMSKKDRQQMATDLMRQTIMQKAEEQGRTREEMQDMEAELRKNQNIVINSESEEDRAKAMGKIIRHGIAMGITKEPSNYQAILATGSAELNRKYLNIQLGMETDKDHNLRIDNLATTLQGEYFDSPDDAHKAAQAIVDGKGIPEDIAKRERPTSFTNMLKQGEEQRRYMDFGLSAKDAANAAKYGINSTIAMQMISPVQAQLHEQKRMNDEAIRHDKSVEGMEGKRLEMEGNRMEIEKAVAIAASRKADAAEANAANKEYFENLRFLIDSYKMKGGIPKPLQPLADQMQAELGTRLGMTMEEKSTFWEGLFGDHHYELVPKVDKGAAESAAGSNKTDENNPKAGNSEYIQKLNPRTTVDDYGRTTQD
jgi:hypothetical protein